MPNAGTAGGRAAEPARRLNDKVEIAVALEAYVRCGGGCMGCALTADERRDPTLLALPVWDAAAAFIPRFVEEHAAREPDLREIGVFLRQGNFLALEEDQLRFVASWIGRLPRGMIGVQFSASAVLAPERLARACGVLAEEAARRDLPLAPELIIDFSKGALPRFRDTYRRNLDRIFDAFGRAVVSINLGPDVLAEVSPAEFVAFVEANGFDIAAVNLVPTLASAGLLAPAWDRAVAWLARAVVEGRSGHMIQCGPALSRAIENAATAEDRPAAMSWIARAMTRLVHIDREGNLCFQQEGAGEFPVGPRVGFAPAGRADEPFEGGVLAALDQRALRLAGRLAGRLARHRACAACPHHDACLSSGGAVAERVIGPLLPDPGSCPNGLRPLFDAVAALRAGGADLGGSGYRLMGSGALDRSRRSPDGGILLPGREGDAP